MEARRVAVLANHLNLPHTKNVDLSATAGNGEAKGRRIVIEVAADTQKMRTNVKDGQGKALCILDEPIKYGGTDMGPAPLQTLLGCLAGCENITTRIIAKRMKLNVSGISYRIKGVWDNSAFLGESDVPTHFQELTLEVEIESPDAIPPQSLKQLQETVDRLCPVSSLIHAAGTKVSSIWTLKQTTTPK